MIGGYEIVTLCGSTRFKNEFMEAQKQLTLEGCIVISVGLFGHSGDDEVLKEGVKVMLDDMHRRKIDMADRVFIIDVNGYVGSSTKLEIEYAKETGKPVSYLTQLRHPEYRDWLELRDSSRDEFGERLCYCGHTMRCECGDPDLETFLDAVSRGDIKLGDPDNGWKKN
jgi:hypothetical protein